MRDHIRIVGILNIVMGCLTALIGIVIFIFVGGAGAIAAMAGEDARQIAVPLIELIGVCIALFFIVLSLPSIIGGWGLLNFKPWARILMIVISVLHLFNFPFGTALGVYGIWALLSEEGRVLFGLPSRAYYPAVSYPASASQVPLSQPPPGNFPPRPPGPSDAH